MIPEGIGIVDTLIGFPHRDLDEAYAFVTRQTREPGSPIGYLFKDQPETGLAGVDDPVAVTVDAMDRNGIERGLVSVDGAGQDAMRRYPDRFIPSVAAEPHLGPGAVRRAHETWGVRAVTLFPAGTFPQVAIDDPLMYPIYATCVELGIPAFCCAGVPGPRLKADPQRVELIDRVMYDFPELVFVTRHGCEPWTDLAVKLMLKWPGLHYSTSAFAPRHYPRAIVDYANTRGADKIIYAGYFPFGLTLERIMGELPSVGFRDHVWPKFLRDNAVRVLGL